MKPIVVIKVGTSTLISRTDSGSYQLNAAAYNRVARQILELRRSGRDVVLVSSSAIGAGLAATNQAVRPSQHHMPELQRLASIGWRHVLNAWANALPGVVVGELLLTRNELHQDKESGEALRVLHALLEADDLPIINENDAITHEEIAFGDNDSLAAVVAVTVKKSPLFSDDISLVILTDVDGVFEDISDPSTLVSEITDIEQYVALAQGPGSENATGGMITKFAAASIARASGIETYIANSSVDTAISQVLAGSGGTRFSV